MASSNQQFVRDTSLPSGWLDLGIGEARLIRSALTSVYGLDFLHRGPEGELDYQPSQGYPKLVDELERLHHAPCVVTTGAKQAAFSALMVARERGCMLVGMRAPAWPPLVQAVHMLGMRVVMCEPEDLDSYHCFLLVSPNNPDGHTYDVQELLDIETLLRTHDKFLIHDAVYACRPYVTEQCPVVGDVQLHSVSKRFGLSGLRVGWAVVRDEEVLAEVQDAVETITAGVSGPSQGAVSVLLRRLRQNQHLANAFDIECATLLSLSRQAAIRFNPDVLEVDPTQVTCGAFAWATKGPKYDPDALRVRLVDGGAYGFPERVRVNLVGDLEDVRELAHRTHQI